MSTYLYAEVTLGRSIGGMGFAAKWLGVVVATAASLPLTEIPAFSKEPEGLLPPEKTVLNQVHVENRSSGPHPQPRVIT